MRVVAVAGIRRLFGRVLRWMRHNKNLIVSASRRTTIAVHVAATSVDVNVRATAPCCVPACPAACMDYFLFRAPGTRPNHTEQEPANSCGSTSPKSGYRPHVFVVGTDVGTPETKSVFATLNANAAKMLASVRLPAKLPPERP